MNKQISSLLLERYSIGEVSDAEKTLVESVLSESAELRERLLSLQQSDAAIRSDQALMHTARHVQERAVLQAPAAKIEANNRKIFSLPYLLPRVGLAAVIMFSIGLAPLYLRLLSSGSTERVKGVVPAITVYRQGSVIEQLTNNMIAHAGDVLQLQYVSGDALYGVIYSYDGKGTVTRHYPAGTNTMLERGTHMLSNSYKLDDAPQFETFVFVSSKNNLDAEKIVLAAGREARGIVPMRILPEESTLYSVRIRKE